MLANKFRLSQEGHWVLTEAIDSLWSWFNTNLNILPGWRPTHGALSWGNTWETDFWHIDTCQVHAKPKLLPYLIEGASPKPCTERQFTEGKIQQCETPFLTLLKLRFQSFSHSELHLNKMSPPRQVRTPSPREVPTFWVPALKKQKSPLTYTGYSGSGVFF